MKNKNLLIVGSLVTLSVVAVAFINPVFDSVKSVYQPRKAEAPAKTNAEDAMEDYKSRRLNPATGLYDVEWLRQSREAVIAENMLQNRASTLVWTEEGPDNVGGRTRAICIDRNDANHVFTGSVSGGLFVSYNGANNWTIVPGFAEYLRISSMCQTLDGTYYIGTGCAFDNWSGEGIWSSTDNGVTWNLVTGSTVYSNVNELQADPIVVDRIWIAGQNSTVGLQSYTPAGGFVTGTGMVTNHYYDVKISPDGQVIIAGKPSGSNIKTYVSTDAGASFTEVSGTGATDLPTANRFRIEYAMSFEKNDDGMWTLYASATSGNLKGVHISEDNGQNWYEIAPSNDIQSTFYPYRNQGTYNSILCGVPGNPDHVLLGGIDIYKWKKSATANPVFGQWYQKTLWNASEFSPIYAHADNHEMEWDQNGFLYIGNDGGVGKSFDGAENIWVPHNRGYNVTQFYGIGFNKYGHTMGGAQDNGTQYKNFTGTTSLEYEEVMGGDGFDCDISQISSDVMFATIYNGDFERSDDEGDNFAFFGPPGAGNFNTVGRLYENKNDTDSQDSIMYISTNNYIAGDTITFVSRTLQIDVDYILTAPLADGDTITLQDPVQSIFCASNAGIWLTRHALRFNVTPTWKEVVASPSGTVTCTEFANNGEVLYAGTSSGTLYIIKNLNTFYSPANDISGITVTTISGFANIQGIGVDPQDEDHVVIAGNGTLKETFTATTATATSSFTDITTSLTSMPTYDAIIDHLDPNIMVMGTENGAYSTNDGGSTWTYQPEMGLVPVYAVRQQSNPDSWNNGVVYLGTFGRGIWSSASLVGIDDIDNTAVAHAEIMEIKTFPNPMATNGTISFNLEERNNVDIYVMDLTGKIVLTKNLGELNEGENRTNINVEGLASGSYIVTIHAGDVIGTDKLIITH